MSIAPFAYNPSWSKLTLFLAAKEYMTATLRFWQLPLPLFHDDIPTKYLHRKHGSGGTHFGLYLVSNVYVNVDDSTMPVTKSNPRRYSYPGNKSDRTAAGIMAHECGHHVWSELIHKQPHILRLWLYCWKPKLKKEPITGYEPTPEEGFAETMRLFALNPMLLKAGAPSRYTFITQDCGLKPPHEVPWAVVLRGAAPSVIAQATKWTEGKKGLL